MSADTWAELDAELACWRDARRVVSLWWRDDDAQVPDDAVWRLADLSARWAVPLSLAVIPDGMSPDLPGVLSHAERGLALQHGFAHVDYAAAGEPAAELGEHRPAARVYEELAEGRQRLASVFGRIFAPVLVPPWNRISQSLVPGLGTLGFRGLSCFHARAGARTACGLAVANCHVDPVDWRGGARFRGEARSLGALVAHLRARRAGQADPEEPTGILTHHRSHDADLWSFLERLFERLAGRPGVRWLDADEVFAL